MVVTAVVWVVVVVVVMALSQLRGLRVQSMVLLQTVTAMLYTYYVE